MAVLLRVPLPAEAEAAVVVAGHVEELNVFRECSTPVYSTPVSELLFVVFAGWVVKSDAAGLLLFFGYLA